MGIIDWMADKVQGITGEKERRQLVQKLKEKYHEFKSNVEKKILEINVLIEKFNNIIQQLNNIRTTKVENHILILNKFLSRFGKIKSIGDYSPELELPPANLPNKEFEKIESYIHEVDWSREDVFINTFFLSPIGMTIKTKKQNLSLNERIAEFQLMAEETLKELRIRALGQTNDNTVAQLYYDCVNFIVDTIDQKIIPELTLVQQFFQAEEITDHILAGSDNKELRSIINISMLNNTQYQKHYNFIKNAFSFYIISCKIYNTPILTHLIQGKCTPEDKEQLLLEQKTLQEQENQLSNSMVLTIGR